MSTFTETITLENVADASAASRGYIPKTQIRSLTLEAMPDTGAWTLVISEGVREKLGLAIEGSVKSTLADGTTEKYPQTEAVKIRWKNRSTTQQAVVLPHAKKVLLGALPLEAMDLQVDPVNECLAGVHGDEPLYTLM